MSQSRGTQFHSVQCASQIHSRVSKQDMNRLQEMGAGKDGIFDWHLCSLQPPDRGFLLYLWESNLAWSVISPGASEQGGMTHFGAW